jgi:hypothetical protein
MKSAENRVSEKLQEIAAQEARSISQVCEMFLMVGVESYEKDGSKYLQHFLARHKKQERAG